MKKKLTYMFNYTYENQQLGVMCEEWKKSSVKAKVKKLKNKPRPEE